MIKELEVAVRNLHKQQSQHQKVDALLFWKSPQAAHQLGSHSKTAPPSQENTHNKIGHQSSLLTMPSKCQNSSPDVDPAPNTSTCFDDAKAILWRSPLTIGIGIHFKTSLQPDKCNPSQQQLGPQDPLCVQSPKTCPSKKSCLTTSPLGSAETSLFISQSTQGV
jgi:hypothetical protein